MIRVAIVGAAGYSGAELLHILLGHPAVEVVALFGSEKGADPNAAAPEIAELHPRFRGITGLRVHPATPESIAARKPDAVFLATPHAASHDLVPALLDRAIVALDLSASFRLADATLYPTHYAFTHARPDLLRSAVYALPELFRERIAESNLLAVPGCYPTSAILPIAPLVRAGAVDPSRRVIIDSISGVSGAGRAANVATLFCEVSVRPYEVLKHRHTPEIEAYAGTTVYFTPQVGPYDRGIVSTIHIELNPGWDASRVRALYESAYSSEPFVRLLPAGKWPSAAAVRSTNFCDIALAADEPNRHLIVVSALDNLIKGAAGQAVQAFNARFALPETLALLPSANNPAGVTA